MSAKLQLTKERIDDMEALRNEVNAILPDDVKIFCLMKVSNNFNAKNMTSFREYSYFLPSFMFTPIQDMFLGRPLDQNKPEEEKDDSAQVVT